MEFFGDVERFLADLYPFRWLVAVVLAMCVAGFVALAIRLGWLRAAAQHPWRSALIGIPVGAMLVITGWYTLSPLWERSYLEEASPLEAAVMTPVDPSVIADAARSPGPATADAAVPSLPRQTHAGMFVGADDFHFGRGSAQLIEIASETYTLRFEDFSVRNGPDLFVYLTPDASGQSIDGAINLGELKATDGAFNYEIPPGTDITQYKSAIVWCRQFATLFAVAELSES